MSSPLRATVAAHSAAPLVARDLSKAYGQHVVLDGVDLVANPGQPVGLVGENGSGKTTLLRLLAGLEPADAGHVARPDELGYLAQDPTFPAGSTLGAVMTTALASLHAAVARVEHLATDLAGPTDEGALDEYADALAWAEAHDAWDADRRAELALERLGLRRVAPDRPAASLSGGERSRLALAAIVTRRPDCVLLDEPTNHLDDDALGLVEEFIASLPGIAVVATHDRVLLDRACRVIVDLDPSPVGLDGSGGARFTGSFAEFRHHQRAARIRWEQAYAEQRDELTRLRRAAETTARQVAHDRPARDNDKYWYHFKRGNVEATIRRRVRDAEQRITVIERDPIPKPPPLLSFDRALGSSGNGSRLVASIRDGEVTGRLSVPWLQIGSGEHLLVSGANGSGKSTLLGLLAGRTNLTSGECHVGARRVGLLPQDVVFADPSRTPRQLYLAMVMSPASDASRRSPAPPELATLGLVHPRDLGRPIGVLSTGQQRRLALAILVAQQPDLLLLDEPTNHISLRLADELEDALGRSPGTVVVASHDRWLRARWDGPTHHLVAPETT